MPSPVTGSGAPNEVAVFSDSKTIGGSALLTVVNGVLSAVKVIASFFKIDVTYVTGQDVPEPPLNIKATWQAERGGDIYGANIELHASGPQQAAAHGIYVSSWSDAWDAYGLDARVESGPDALQSYGAQLTVIANNPSAAQSGLRISMHGATDGSELREALLINDVAGPNTAAIRTKQGAIVFGDLIQPGGGLKPVYVDTATGKLVVGS